MDILKKYYTDAYSLIRKVDVKGWVVFDTPYGPYPAADPMNWWQFMTEKEYVRTMNDYHYYQLYTSAQVPLWPQHGARRCNGALCCVATARCAALQPVLSRLGDYHSRQLVPFLRTCVRAGTSRGRRCAGLSAGHVCAAPLTGRRDDG